MDSSHVELLKNEEKYVGKRDHAVARTLVTDDTIRTARKQADELITRSKRQYRGWLGDFSRKGFRVSDSNQKLLTHLRRTKRLWIMREWLLR